MRHSLWKRMELKIEIANNEDHDQEKDSDRHEKIVGLPRCGDEDWQVLNRGRMDFLVHVGSPIEGSLFLSYL
jgi:hypothetical protein